MTFESTSPLGNRKGCFTLGFLQLPVHASNQWHRKINRYSIRKPTKYFTKPKFSIMRLCGVFFLERNGMRELGMYKLKIHMRRLYSDQMETESFWRHCISEMYPFPSALINTPASSSFQPHHFPSFRNDGFILTLTMIKYF